MFDFDKRIIICLPFVAVLATWYVGDWRVIPFFFFIVQMATLTGFLHFLFHDARSLINFTQHSLLITIALDIIFCRNYLLQLWRPGVATGRRSKSSRTTDGHKNTKFTISQIIVAKLSLQWNTVTHALSIEFGMLTKSLVGFLRVFFSGFKIVAERNEHTSVRRGQAKVLWRYEGVQDGRQPQTLAWFISIFNFSK